MAGAEPSTGRSPLALRPVRTPDEIRRVASLAREIWTEHYTPIIGSAQVDYMLATIQSERAIEEQIGQGYDYRLLLSEGGAAGYLAVLPVPHDETLFLSKLYIRREMRGRALAAEAMSWVEDEARSLRLRSISLTVNKHNPALAAYKRLGFIVSGEVVAEIGGGFVMDDYRMSKEVT